MINRTPSLPSKMLGLLEGLSVKVEVICALTQCVVYYMENPGPSWRRRPKEEWIFQRNGILSKIYRGKMGGTSRSSESRVRVSGKALQSVQQEAGNWGVGR